VFDDTAADSARPYICEISKMYLYRIVNYDRGFDYGIDEIDPALLRKDHSSRCSQSIRSMIR
jgi:hypothetical protein